MSAINRLLLAIKDSRVEFFGTPKKTRGFSSPADLKLMVNPKYHAKVDSKINHYFDIYIANYPGYNKWLEHGYMKEAQLEKDLPEFYKDFKAKHPEGFDKEKISIILTNNIGQDRFTLTPWIICHRIGHALWSFKKTNLSATQDSFEALKKYYFTVISQFETDYGIKVIGRKNSRNNYDQLHTFFEVLGTTRAAREKKLVQGPEYFYEQFAQYILTGKVKLNRLEPDEKFPAARFRPLSGKRPDKVVVTDLNYMIEHMEDDSAEQINDTLISAKGHVFIM